MGKDKHKRFAEGATFSNMYQPLLEELLNVDYKLKGKWHSEVFQNHHPIVLELGCGKGEYTVELARRYPEKNFIGIDVKGARMWRGAKDSLEQQIPNTRFVRTRIEFITSLFATNEVSEIWITFPDPQPQGSRQRKRLTSSRFLKEYATLIKPDGIIHLKTDSQFLYEYTKSLLSKNNIPLILHTNDLYHSPYSEYTYGVKTHYEKIFLAKGMPITYMQFSLNGKTSFDEPEEK